MAFELEVAIRNSAARTTLADTRTDLKATETAAESTTEALTAMGQAGNKAAADLTYGMKSAAGTVGATGQTFSDFYDKIGADQARVLQEIKGPWERFQSDLKATNLLFEAGKISIGEFEGASGRLADRLDELQKRDLSPQLRLETELFEQITGPIKRYEQELQALDSLLKAEQISLDQYDAALSRVQKRAQSSGGIGPAQGPVFKQELAGLAEGPILGPAFDPNQAGRGITAELQKEEDILRRINGPMLEHEATVRALNSLLEKGKIDLVDYNAQLERAGKAAGAGLGPVQGPKQQTAGGAAGGWGGGELGNLLQAAGPQLGQGGYIVSQFASGGAFAAAGVVALVAELGHLGDQYRELANRVERFTSDSVSADDILRQQLDLSKELHSNLEGAAALYVKVHEATSQLNLSSRQQLGLAHDLGVEVAAEGRSAEDAAALMQRLSLAFETGAIGGRELRSIMRTYPELAGQLADALGHTTAELIQLANKGQISAQDLIAAFHKIAPEAESTVNGMRESIGQKALHMWDDVKIGVGGAIDKLLELDEDEDKVVQANIERHIRGQRQAAQQLQAELAKNAKTAEIITAAQAAGIDIAPFSKDAADKITEMRMAARQAGIDVADAFDKAKSQAQFYGTKLDEIKNQRAAEEIAEQVKRMYNAMRGADDMLHDQAKSWAAVTDEVKTLTEAITKMKQIREEAGTPQTQGERDLILKRDNDQTKIDYGEYGEKVTSYAQGLNNARAELERLNAAHKAGVVVGEAFRKQQDALLTTLNDGRLPETVKLWEEFHLPQQQFQRDEAALVYLLHSGSITLGEYTQKLRELRDALDKSGFQKMLDEEHDAFVRNQAAMERYLAGHTTMAQDYARYQAQQKEDQIVSAIGAQAVLPVRGYEQALQRASAAVKDLGLDQQALVVFQRQARDQFDSSTESLYKATVNVVGYQQALDKLIRQRDAAGPRDETYQGPAAQQFQAGVAQLDRAAKLVEQFDQPLATYKQKLGDVSFAVVNLGLSEDRATVLRRKYREELNAANEALQAQKGPIEAYQAAIRKLGDQLEAGDISQKQFADGIDKARVTMLQATGQANEFKGALEIGWIKLKDEANQFGASVANMAIEDFGKLNDAIVTMANGGQVSWSQMADSMIQDLERVALKMLEVKAISGLIGMFGGGGGVSGLADTSNTDILTQIGVEGYAEGGTGIVGGSGGVDSQLVALRATPGERVTITPPGAYPYMPASAPSAGSTAARSGAPVIQVHNHYDSDVVTAGITSGAGQTAVLNVLRANRAAIRATLGIS